MRPGARTVHNGFFPLLALRTGRIQKYAKNLIFTTLDTTCAPLNAGASRVARCSCAGHRKARNFAHCAPTRIFFEEPDSEEEETIDPKDTVQNRVDGVESDCSATYSPHETNTEQSSDEIEITRTKRSYNIVIYLPGIKLVPKSAKTPLKCISLFLNDEMIEKILIHLHEYIQHGIPKKTLVKEIVKKIVLMLSSLHDDDKIDQDIGTEAKPEVITFYNSTKGGVEVVDQKKEDYPLQASLGGL
ncbi:hypothetical protein EVAR_62384_1 [Eumeta japonica]|uniref:Uncharacterized protein n=1 Tax=Eumeta variegata TaxID=151549 RepID=A0A4C1Z1D5_EUMVA|nr:hypothetical protein EVAR_62384_1 [Eumeta japonica]